MAQNDSELEIASVERFQTKSVQSFYFDIFCLLDNVLWRLVPLICQNVFLFFCCWLCCIRIGSSLSIEQCSSWCTLPVHHCPSWAPVVFVHLSFFLSFLSTWPFVFFSYSSCLWSQSVKKCTNWNFIVYHSLWESVCDWKILSVEIALDWCV